MEPRLRAASGRQGLKVAIDTANRRNSAGQFMLTVSLPAPDGTIDAPDRLHTAWLYSGIAASAPAASANNGELLYLRRRRRFKERW